MQEEKKFRKGEIVWAKVRGFPWWPGVIKRITKELISLEEEGELKFQVNFIGDTTHSVLPIDKIGKYDEKYSYFSKSKQKKLLDSIKMANSIIKGDISYEDHMVQLHRKKHINSLKESNSNGSESSRKSVFLYYNLAKFI